MAHAIQYIVELSKEEAQRLLEDKFNPKPNPARDAALKRARALKITVK